MKTDPIVVRIDKDLEDLMPAYVQNRHSELQQLRELFTQKAWTQIQSIGHKLAGNAGGYGLDELGQIGRLMEHAAQSNDVAVINNCIGEIADYLSRLTIIYE